MQNKVMFIIIIVLLLVLVGAVATFAFFFIRSSNAQQEVEIDPAPSAVFLSEDEMTDISLGDPIRTNLATSADGGEHIINASLVVSVNNTTRESPAIIALLNDKQPIMRSVAISVMRRKTIQDLRRPDGKEVLEDDILARLQEQFGTNLIVRVVANELGVQ